MRVIKFRDEYETITPGKEYEVLPKSYNDGVFEYLTFLDDINEEILLKQCFGQAPSDMFEVYEK